MAEVVRSKVESGEYATESEVFRDGVRVLIARDRAVDSWLRDKVRRTYDTLKADPRRTLSVDQVRTSLAAKRQKATVKV
jgi:Arc/MetJ-type ribon-helix-helix transcriptional regulator